jgi:hypothetical protein
VRYSSYCHDRLRVEVEGLPRVHGWQAENEPSFYQSTISEMGAYRLSLLADTPEIEIQNIRIIENIKRRAGRGWKLPRIGKYSSGECCRYAASRSVWSHTLQLSIDDLISTFFNRFV